tara:strand:+ start:41 stop:307 length:267 start_codon:yes stop_codon:yes gene_type:complete
MPRTENANNYHFKASYLDEENNKEVVRYYTTMKSISSELGVSRSTLYNYMNGRSTHLITNPHLSLPIKYLEKLKEPLPIYKKVMVRFD